MIIATHHEGDLIHLDPTLDMVVLGVSRGKVKFGFAQPQPPSSIYPASTSEQTAPESRTATIALVVGRSDRHAATEYVSCTLHNGILTVQGHASSYYLSQPGRPPMLVVTCEANQRIRINDAIDVVVLRIQDSQDTCGLACRDPICHTAWRFAERLRRVPAKPFDGLPPQAAFSL